MANDSNSLASLKSMIDDNDYKQLQKCFLLKESEIPYDRPHIPEVTNRLLLQLHFLKQEDNATLKQLKAWLEQLVPNMETVTESRVYQRIKFIIDKCNQSTPDATVKFLTDSHCFHSHSLSASLTAIGLTWFHLCKAVPYDVPPCADVSNQIVIDLVKFKNREMETHTYLHRWLKRLSLSCVPLTYNQINRKVDKCWDNYKKLMKNKSDTGIMKLNDFLKVPFVNKQADESIQTTSNLISCTGTNLIDVKKEQNENSTIEILKCNNTELASKLQLQEDLSRSFQKQFEEEKKRADEMESKLKVEVIKNAHLQKELEEVTKSTLYNNNHAQKKRLQNEIVEEESLIKEVESESKDAKSLCSVEKKLKLSSQK